MDRKKQSRFRLWAASVTMVTLALSVFFGLQRAAQNRSSAESIIRMGIVGELFGADSRGYHALIDSVMLTPLPTLAAAPFIAAERLAPGAGFIILAACAAAGAMAYLMALTQLLGMTWIPGALLGVVALLTPWSPAAAWQASSVTGSFFLLTAVATHLTGWLRRERLMSLGLAASLLAVALLWDTRFYVLVPLGVALVAGHVRVGPKSGRWQKLEGLTLVFLTPVLYIPAIWVLFNWLIFGRPLWLLHDTPTPALFLALWSGLVVSAAAVFVFLFFGRRHLAEALVIGIYGVLSVGLLLGSVVPLSPAAAAARGRDADSISDRANRIELKQYVERHLSGRMVLVIGKPGYQARNLLGKGAPVVHRLELSGIDSILVDTRGRDLYALLTTDQVELWRSHFGQAFWGRRFLDEATFDRWHLFYCVRPVALDEEEE